MDAKLIPVTLLTGFFKSGKFTLLSLILNDFRIRSTVVVANEFGEVGLDGESIRHSEERLRQQIY